MKKMRGQNWLYLAMMLLLGIFLTLSLTASPLRVGNGWDDTNAMLRIGELWLDGVIPFKDVFEQRGPVMYALYASMNLISREGYLGLFIVEVLNFFVMQWALKRLLRHLYPEQMALTTVMATLLPMLMVLTQAFKYGGSPEEFSITFVLIAAVATVDYFKSNGREIRHFITIGMTFAAVFLIKYSLIGPWIAIGLVTLVWLIRQPQTVRQLLRVLGHSLIGIALVAGPILALLAYQGALKAFYDVYFITNLSGYSTGGDGSAKLSTLAHFLQSGGLFVNNAMSLYIVWCILVVFALAAMKVRRLAVTIALTIALTAGLTYWSFRVMSYMMLMILVLGFVAIACACLDYWPKRWRVTTKSSLALMFLVTAGLAGVAPFTNGSIYITPWRGQGELPAAQFGAKINQREANQTRKPQLLYLSMIDFGVERFTPLASAGYHFERTNLTSPAQQKGLDDAVATQRPDYLVVRADALKRPDVQAGYVVIDQAASLKARPTAKIVGKPNVGHKMYYLMARKA